MACCKPPPCCDVSGCCPPQNLRKADKLKPWDPNHYKSVELRGGQFYNICHCLHRNGLQHDCPKWDCGGLPECLCCPYPRCRPSGGGGPSVMPSKVHDEALYRSHHHRKQLFIKDLGSACGQPKSLNIEKNSWRKVKDKEEIRKESCMEKNHQPCSMINISDPSSITYYERTSKPSHHHHHPPKCSPSYHNHPHKACAPCKHSPKSSPSCHHCGSAGIHPPMAPIPPTPPQVPSEPKCCPSQQQAAICVVDDDYKVEPVYMKKQPHYRPNSPPSSDNENWLHNSLDWAEKTIHETNRKIKRSKKSHKYLSDEENDGYNYHHPPCAKDRPKQYCDTCSPPEPFHVKTDKENPLGVDCRTAGPEIRGGKYYAGCTCHKRNGLQDDCPLTICQGRGCNNPPCAKAQIRGITKCKPPYHMSDTNEEDQKRLKNLRKCECKEFFETQKNKEHYHRAGYPCPICDKPNKSTVDENSWKSGKMMCRYDHNGMEIPPTRKT